MRIRVSIFPGVKAGYRAFVSGWTRLALKFKRRVSAGDWDSPRPHSLFVFFSASSSGWSSVFGSMLLIDCVLRSLIVCCGRGWWLQKLLLSTDLLQVILTAMFSWARGSCGSRVHIIDVEASGASVSFLSFHVVLHSNRVLSSAVFCYIAGAICRVVDL
uniref:Uncharacterized protein n=2 Tax=Physcomitrium patens TaxID=3218 RepID=A0A7I4BD60_PHYPA|nr:uncharacterized protein LOC112294147 isoform X1 [Physcomitrium patens]|eukprot:XP_024400118.1 uncharacterized protein LOC112294147 isoform X1 [Physcomitrella patens]